MRVCLKKGTFIIPPEVESSEKKLDDITTQLEAILSPLSVDAASPVKCATSHQPDSDQGSLYKLCN